MSSTISNAQSIAYEFSSQKSTMKNVKELAEQKKKKKVFLQSLKVFDPSSKGEILMEDFNKASTESQIVLDEDDFDFLRQKFVRNGKVLYQAVIKDLGFKMIENTVLWCLNSNPKNKNLKKDTRKDNILERLPV